MPCSGLRRSWLCHPLPLIFQDLSIRCARKWLPACSKASTSVVTAGYAFVSAKWAHTPGARTAWHTHPNGQMIYVLEGVGHCQRRGGPIEVIGPGDRVFFEPGEEHWHAPRQRGS